jgi:hypothetical protein
MPIKEFRMDESSNWIRAELAEFSLTAEGSPIPVGATEWDGERYLAKLNPEDALPGLTNIQARVRLTFSESKDGRTWTTVLGDNGQPFQESREATFKTGERPKTIAMQHIRYAYPVPEQQYFLRHEHPQGFLRLDKNYGYLFNDATTIVRVRFRSGSEMLWTDAHWNQPTLTLSWNQPELQTNRLYTFEIVSLPKDATTSGGIQATYAQATMEGAGESSAEMLTNTAGDAGSEGEFIILGYSFRTSRFNTFEEKMEQLVIRNVNVYSLLHNVGVDYIWSRMTTSEGFDQSDIDGNEFTQNKSLIVVRSAMNDNYHRNIIAPLLYTNYPFGGAVAFSRGADQSIVPDWAIVKNIGYTYGSLVLFPWDYFLANTYYQDLRVAQTRLANAQSSVQNTYYSTFTARFPMLQRNSNYDLRFAYTLPNGVVTNTSIVKTFIVP